MQAHNNKLEVGMQAMIIGTYQPENSALIGKIVTILDLPEIGADLTQYFDIDDGKIIERRGGRVVTSGGPTPMPVCSEAGHHMKSEFIYLKRQYLMPLPPMEWEDLIKESDLELTK